MESMDDYKEELEASFRRIREGDILTGTVIDVNEEGVTLDLKYYAPGFISAEEMSSDPGFLTGGGCACGGYDRGDRDPGRRRRRQHSSLPQGSQ